MHVRERGETGRRDLELARRASQADRDAFDAVFERFAGRVHRFVAARTPDPRTAEALTQRAMEAVFGDLGGYAGEESLDAWVLRRLLAQLAATPPAAGTTRADRDASGADTRSAWLPPAAETPS